MESTILDSSKQTLAIVFYKKANFRWITVKLPKNHAKYFDSTGGSDKQTAG